LSKSCNIHQTNKLLVSSSTPSDSESILKYTGLLEIRIKNEKMFTRELTLFTEEIKKRIRIDQVYISDLKSKWKSSQVNKFDTANINNRSLNAERINSNTVKLNQSVEYIRSTLNLIKQKEKKIKKLTNAYVIIHSAIHGTGDIHQISSDFYLSVKKLIIELNSQLISFINISFEVPVLTKTSPLNLENYVSEKERFDKENNNNNNNKGRQKVKNPISYDDLDLRHLSTNQNTNTLYSVADLPSKHLQTDKNYSQQHHHLLKQQISKFTSDQKESKDVYEKHVG
jgi:hypothetical protein